MDIHRKTIQEREVKRLGGIATLKVDVRFFAATNRALQDSVKNGSISASTW